ncbi:MAG: cyclic nucleotide-binding domain-containing protein [Bacteroidales bacterium]|nr:cyclic nucleotide-binding domain-containing protein [Bacteroidales bacterium]MDD3666437.1 cyclic nucleotide-binding domain-containing protein [Bacteroidales bacterium]
MESTDFLAKYLEKDPTLSQREIGVICQHFCEEHLKREEAVVKEGTQYKKLLFVVEGILRVFIIDSNGEEVVKNFIEPNGFFAEFESFDRNGISRINVSAVTDCLVLSITKTACEHLIQLVPQWGFMMKTGGLEAMSAMLRKKEFLLLGDSTDHYRHFLENYPHLVQQVPLKYIASFLRITQSSLSRIRRQIE